MRSDVPPGPFHRVCIFAPDAERVGRTRERLARMLAEAGFAICDEPRSPADAVISLGGDGTFLRAVHRFLPSGAAFLGINAGHLGFLQEAEEESLAAAVDRLRHGRFRVSEERLLEVAALGRGEPRVFHALNDAVVERRDTRTLRLHVRVDGRDLGPVVADGILVSSPLGSTAYAYAAGGAIVHPEAAVLQVIALNPHRSQLGRAPGAPLIVPDTSTVEVWVDWARGRNARLVVDGEEAALGPGEHIRVRRSAATIRIVRFDQLDFWERLRAKLG